MIFDGIFYTPGNILYLRRQISGNTFGLHPLREILEVSILEFGNSDLEEELGVKECERK